ncbi:MAG: T9SS type A sorting domain-containing protein, partial [Sphingobacteriales bacterium]
TVQFKTGVQAERISLNDMTGKLVLQTQANANEISIDLRQVPPGMYLLTMHRQNGTPATAQIIVRP